MAGYRANSHWNDEMELECLLVFKILEKEGFPHGRQKELSERLASRSRLEWGSISAKVSNYKSLAGKNNHSNVSKNSVRIFQKFNHLSIEDIANALRHSRDGGARIFGGFE